MNLTKYLTCAALAWAMAACSDEGKYSSIENGVYIAEAAPSDQFNQQTENLFISDKDTNLKLTIRLAAPLTEDVTVSVFTDPSLVEEYNRNHPTSFEMLPEKYFSMKESVVIPAGEIKGEPFNVNVKPFLSPNGEKYALPIRIAVSQGNIPALTNANKILYLMKKANQQKSIVLRGGEKVINFKEPLPTGEWTFEYWIKVNNTTGQPTGEWEGEDNINFRRKMFADDAAPIHLGCENSEYILLRYYADGVKKIAPILQCQLNGPYFDSSEFWRPDTWYHIAYTYDGNNLTLYKNGDRDNGMVVSKNFSFNKMTLCSKFSHTMEVEFAQIRLWNQCLSPNAIKGDLGCQIPIDSEGLIGYWKCDEGKDKIVKDHSKSGNNLDFSSGSTNISWSKKVYDFSNPNPKE